MEGETSPLVPGDGRSIARSGLDGTLQRANTLQPGSFTDVPSRTNTTETSYEETSTDPKAFFRLAIP